MSAGYDLLNEIGRGDGTIVWRAYDRELKRRIAIRVLDEQLRADARRAEQHWEEARQLAKVNHDNIVQVYGVDPPNGWIMMELMRGSIASKVAEAPQSPDLVRSVLRQILNALQFLHQRGLVHGQVRPSNILINDEGRVKLSDFGGVNADADFPRPRSTKYIAPEMLNQNFGPVGPSVDLYSLGLTALEMLKGPAFNGIFKNVGSDAKDAEIQWMRWHCSAEERLPPARDLVPGIPDDLAKVIDRLLSKEVAKRYRTADEVLKALDDKPIVLVDLAKPAAATKAPKAPKKETSQAGKKFPTSEPKPWTKEWFNKKLENPYVLYSVCGGIIAITLLLMFSGRMPALAGVEIQSDPSGATIFVDDQKQEQLSDSILQLPIGKRTIRVQLDGYPDPAAQEIEVAKGSEQQNLRFVFQKPPPPPPDPDPDPKPTGTKPPDPVPTIVEFTCEPPTAIVTVGGKPTKPSDSDAAKKTYSLSPDELAAGTFEIEAKAEGYEVFKKPLTAAELKSLNNAVAIRLNHAVEFVPATCIVSVDGAKQTLDAAGKVVIKSLPENPVLISATCENYLELKEKPYTYQELAKAGFRIALTRDPSSGWQVPPGVVAAPGAKAAADGSGFPDRVISEVLSAAGAPLELVYISPGEFEYGVKGGPAPGELSSRTAKIEKAFYVGTTEISRKQWGAYLAAQKQPAANPLSAGEENLPAVSVTLDDARKFCDWVKGRLPTEVEWERVARGTQARTYPWMEKVIDAQHANLRFDAGAKLLPVDALPESVSPEGVFNLLGNVAEWCNDVYEIGYGDLKEDPGIVQKWNAIRGGSFRDPSLKARSTMRANSNPAGSDDIGVRVIIPAPER